MTTGLADTLDDSSTTWRQALAILALSTVIRLAIAMIVPLFPDEAYYWEWSRRLAGGYFDHPPMIAVLIAGGTALFGDTPIGVRFFPVLAGSAAGLAVASTARRLAGGAAARYAALAFAVFPLAAAGLVLATPDAPLLAALAWALHAMLRAVDAPRASVDAARWWVVGGLTIGIAMASKFTGVFIPIALLLAFVVHPPLRGRLRESGPWIVVVVASLVMVPVLVWNAQHEWIAFRFQLGHGFHASARETWVQRELRLVGGQMALVTPILFVLMVGAVARALAAPRDARRFPFAVITVFCFAFFAYTATRRAVEENWPAIGWLPALVLLAAVRPAVRTAWERRAVWLAGALSAIVLVHVVVPILPLPPRRDQVSLAYGWDGVAAAVDSARRALTASSPAGTAPVIATTRYQDAAMLAFHLPRHDDVTAMNLGGRRNQYDLWSRFTDRARVGDDLLLVLEIPRQSVHAAIPRYTAHFSSVTPGPIIPLMRDDAEVARRQLWVLSGWTGTWPADTTDPRRPWP